jgi:hypothetical protein
MKTTTFLAGAVAAGPVLGIMAGSQALAAVPPSDDVYGYTDFYGVPRLAGTCVAPADPTAVPDHEEPNGWLSIADGQARWFLGECPRD